MSSASKAVEAERLDGMMRVEARRKRIDCIVGLHLATTMKPSAEVPLRFTEAEERHKSIHAYLPNTDTTAGDVRRAVVIMCMCALNKRA